MVSTWDAPVQKELMLVEEQLRESIRSEQPMLTEISNYIITSGGKRMRPAVAILIFKATGGTVAPAPQLFTEPWDRAGNPPLCIASYDG